MSGTKVHSNYEDLLTFTRASKGHALRPVSYGSEEVTNGTFDSDLSGWTIVNDDASNTVTYDSGAVDFVGDGSVSLSMNQTNVFTVGVLYQLTIDVTVNAGNVGGIKIQYAGLDSSIGVVTESGSYTFNFVPNSKKLEIYRRTGGQATNVTIDNVSVKEVLFDQPDGTLTLFEHPNGVPRVEWDAQKNRLGLLVEESRTNLLEKSEPTEIDTQFNTQFVTLSFNEESPTQSNKGIKVTAKAANDTHIVQWKNGVFAYPSGVATYTMSIFVKDDTAGYVLLSLTGGSPNILIDKVIDLSDGSITRNFVDTGEDEIIVKEAGNGWYRISIVHTTDGDAGSSPTFKIGPHNGSNNKDYIASGTESIYVFGAQFEAGSFPTSYMKTEGSTASRSADVASIPVADFGYNTAVGSLFAEYYPTKVEGQIRSVFELALDSNDRLYSASSTSRHWFVKSGGTDQANIDLGSSTEDQSNKIAGAYKKDDFAASLDGGSVTTDTSGSVQTGITDLQIGGIKSSADNYLNGHIKSIQYYPRRLTNAQLEALTEPRSTPTLSLTFDGLESSYTENYIHG